MGKPLSTDLRSRLVAAVAGGLSRRAAAVRFGVSAASAVRWAQAVNTTGTVAAKPQGGDTRSHRIEGFSGVILTAIAAQKDISLVELAEMLRTQHGVSFGASTVWRCLDRHGMTFKKNSGTQPSKSDPTSQPGAKLGSQRSLISIRRVWSSSTKPVPRPRWPGCEAVPCGASAAGLPSHMGTGRQRHSQERFAWVA
jgi:transposase